MSGLFRAMAALLCAAACAGIEAQTYPTRSIRLVVPYSPGGASDTLARAVGQRLAETWGQSVVVDNKPGANTIIGTEEVARAAADGYTVLLNDPALSYNASLYGKLRYDALRDFAPVTGLVVFHYALVAHPSVPAKTFAELVQVAKARPGQLTYASFGLGSTGHLAMELVQSMAGIRLNHVPYKGAAPALNDVVAGHVHLVFSSVSTALPHWKAGKVTMLGVCSAARLPQYPDVPTLGETVQGFESTAWFGLFAPAGSPREAIARINGEVRRIVADAAFQERHMVPQAFEPMSGSPEQFTEFFRSEVQKWGKVVRESKLRLD